MDSEIICLCPSYNNLCESIYKDTSAVCSNGLLFIPTSLPMIYISHSPRYTRNYRCMNRFVHVCTLWPFVGVTPCLRWQETVETGNSALFILLHVQEGNRYIFFKERKLRPITSLYEIHDINLRLKKKGTVIVFVLEFHFRLSFRSQHRACELNSNDKKINNVTAIGFRGILLPYNNYTLLLHYG